jgi:tetratricopeptide (TPR) repeat protein
MSSLRLLLCWKNPPLKTMFSRLASTLSLALLVSCANQTPIDEPEELAQASALAEANVVDVVYPEKAFPDDSLHALLLAEFALRRQVYSITLQTYLDQAPLLRDAGVSAHATHLAQFFNRDSTVLEAALLWVELEPDNIEARATSARQLVKLGRNAEALPHLEAIERNNGSANFALVTNNFGRLSEEARTTIFDNVRLLAQQFPDNISLLFTQSLLYAEMDYPEKALETLNALFTIDPDQTQGLLLEAKVLSDQGDNNPFKRINKTLKENPDNRDLRMRFARILAATDMQAAREQFEILSAQAPEDGDLLFSLALINREIGDPITASAYLRQLIALGERVDEAHYYLGQIEQDRNQTEDALTHYKAVRTGREYLAASSRIGEIFLDQGEIERTQTWFITERRDKPKYRAQLYGLEADLLQRKGMEEAAANLLDEALTHFPEDSSLLYTRAMLREQRGKLTQMEADLRDIISREPDNATALNALGYTLADHTDRFEEALVLVSQALKLQPDEPAILDSMGWVLFRLQRNDEALSFLKKAYERFPDPEVAAHLGEVMWVTGDTQGALEVWRAANARDPEHPVLKNTLQRLSIKSLAPPPMDNRPQE